jgi:hypothetical protein
MKQHTSQRTALGTFLIIGTLLALYISITGAYDIFVVHTTWMHRDGLIQKIVLVLLYSDIPLLFIAGLTSTISFFRKGHIWQPVTKGIIINIFLWLTYAGIMIGIAPIDLIFKICSLLVIGLVIWLMSQIWTMIRL